MRYNDYSCSILSYCTYTVVVTSAYHCIHKFSLLKRLSAICCVVLLNQIKCDIDRSTFLSLLLELMMTDHCMLTSQSVGLTDIFPTTGRLAIAASSFLMQLRAIFKFCAQFCLRCFHLIEQQLFRTQVNMISVHTALYNLFGYNVE